MKPRFAFLARSAVFAALSLALVGGTAVYAYISDMYDSVHFHSGHPDLGTPPRRDMVNGDYDSRPSVENGMCGYYSESQDRKLELSTAGEAHHEAERQNREAKARQRAARALERNQ